MTQNLEEIRDSAELWKAIQTAAGVELSEVPILAKYLWFPTPQTGGVAPTVIEMGSEADIPVKPGYITFAMFQDDAEVRVYALAKSAKDGAGKPNPPTRLALSKHAPLIGVEIMALDVFIDEIADELGALAGLDESDEDEEGPGDEDEPDEPDEPEPDAAAPNGGVETVG